MTQLASSFRSAGCSGSSTPPAGDNSVVSVFSHEMAAAAVLKLTCSRRGVCQAGGSVGGDARCLMAGWWSGKILRASCLVSGENHNSVTVMLCRGGE